MHTKDKLAAALREVGLDDMADKAATGYYHDFLSPLDFPELQLEADLRAQRDLLAPLTRDEEFRLKRDAIEALRQRHLNGDFDASTEESEEWYAGPEGQDAMSRLAKAFR
jgi:hypothetical protein